MTPSQPNTESKSVAEVLRKALAAFGPDGEHWTKGREALTAPYCCALTSFERAGVDEDAGVYARTILRYVLGDTSLVLE